MGQYASLQKLLFRITSYPTAHYSNAIVPPFGLGFIIHKFIYPRLRKGKTPSITILRDIARCFNMSLTEFVAIIEEKLNNQRIADTK